MFKLCELLMSLRIMYKILHSTLYNNLHYNFNYSSLVTRAKLCFCSKQSQTLFDFVWSKNNIFGVTPKPENLVNNCFFLYKVLCHMSFIGVFLHYQKCGCPLDKPHEDLHIQVKFLVVFKSIKKVWAGLKILKAFMGS